MGNFLSIKLKNGTPPPVPKLYTLFPKKVLDASSIPLYNHSSNVLGKNPLPFMDFGIETLQLWGGFSVKI